MDQQARRFAAPVFAAVMFFSAALIFLLQPMFSRMVTPLMGGSASVWNTSMVFFQAALLLGYGYAHALARLKSLPTQVMIHAAVLAAGFIVLPIAVSPLVGAPDTARPVMWLLGALTLSVGAPYAAASATAPLLQAWYARTGKEDAQDPYHLYAASNLGSLLGLLGYPLAMEPSLGIAAQSGFWSAGYVAIALAVVLAGWVAIQSRGAAPAAVDNASATWRQRLFWVAAAAVPSSLMLGVTSHISTDIASAPFLWVAPLALYLITFVVAFGKGGETWRGAVSFLHPLSLAALIVAYSSNDFLLTLGASLACFFLSALVCHLALSASRPTAGRLTEFYMWVSLGGVVGGAATALLAPVIFNDVYEYPLALAAVALFLPRKGASLDLTGMLLIGALGVGAAIARLVWPEGVLDQQDFIQAGAIIGLCGLVLLAPSTPGLDKGLALIGVGALGLVAYVFFQQGQEIEQGMLYVALGVLAVAIFVNRGAPYVAAGLVLAAFATVHIQSRDRDIAFQGRSFFGVTRIVEYAKPDGLMRVMLHGTTIHGAQYVTGARTREPLTYYHTTTALGHAIKTAVDSFPVARIGLVGLGSGSTTCLKRPGDTIRIYEIDPMVVEFSTKSNVFTFAPQCAPEAPVVLGDARLGVAKEPDSSLDVLVVDAFSSDAVPAHLLTKEAIELYLRKLSPRGVVILHLSNRNLDLVAEAARVAWSGPFGALWASTDPETASDIYTSFGTSVMVIGANQAVVEALVLGPEWSRPDRPEGRPWSDDYINMLRPIQANLGQ